MTGARAGSQRGFHIAIIGAGISGICMGIQLKRAGIHNFTIYEKQAELGGAWRDVSYPGCTSHVPSYLQSFSFEQKLDWPRTFPSQAEILDYLHRCAAKYGLRPHISFDNEITRARFIAQHGVWQIESARGDEMLANVLVSACGGPVRPMYPDIEGIDRFQGTCFHAACWDHDHDLGGERVAVIGDGLSASRLIADIASDVEHLTAFQPTSRACFDRPYSAAEHKWLRRLTPLKHLYRYSLYLRLECLQLESRWPALAFGAGTRGRPRNGVHQANIELVERPIARVTSTAVETIDGGSYPVETIILATGFETAPLLASMEIEGKDGRTLAQRWSGGAQAYLGLQVAGFPNLFMCCGPNTHPGHNSVVFMIECQGRYIIKCVRALLKRRLRYLDVREEAVNDFERDLQTRGGRHGESGPNHWPYSTVYYWWKTLEPDFGRFLQVGSGEVDVAARPLDLEPPAPKPPRSAVAAEAQAAVR